MSDALAMTSKPVNKEILALMAGPSAAVLVCVVMNLGVGLDFSPSFVTAITVWCGIWWITEAVPIPITSLIPLALLPLFDVLSPEDIAVSYGDEVIFLLLGGFMLSKGLVKNGAHKSIALAIVHLIGSDSSVRLVLGFMFASALLSMWISNVATSLMLLPVALAVLEGAQKKDLTIPLLLAICYGASIGGIGTPIGTPPNLLFMQVYEEATGKTIGFIDWMKMGIPVVVILLPVVAWWLTRNLPHDQKIDLPKTRWDRAQIIAISVFGLTALLWITRTNPFGGWSSALGLTYASDGMVALMAVVLLFVVPDGKGCRLLDWKTAKTIPWDLLLLVAGGIALSKAFTASGLSDLIGNQLGGLTVLPLVFLILVVAFMVTFTTEVVSNTATTAIFMPILAALGVAIKLDNVAILMVPAVMSASCAFMMPFATGPNAVVFGSGEVPIQKMARYGFALNVICAPVIVLICYIIL